MVVRDGDPFKKALAIITITIIVTKKVIHYHL